MNLKQKVQVEKLKNEGYSFKEISEKLNVSVGTVKSYFARKDQHPKCNCCGVELTGAVKRERRFCSDKCRMKWWRDNSDVSRTTVRKGMSDLQSYIYFISKQETDLLLKAVFRKGKVA